MPITAASRGAASALGATVSEVPVATAAASGGTAASSRGLGAIQSHEIPATPQARTFFLTPFFEICFLTTVSVRSSCSTYSSMHLTFKNSSASLWNPRNSGKGDWPEPFASAFLLLCDFHMNLNSQNS